MTAALQQRWFNNHDLILPGTVTNHVVDASNDGIAYIFMPETNDPITHVGTRYGARTGTPPIQSWALEGLDTSGYPDAADLGGGSPTLATDTPPADTTHDGTWRWYALTNAYTPVPGVPIAAVRRYSSGTIDGSNNSSYARNATGLLGASSRGFPYVAILTAGVWSKPTQLATPFAYRTATKRIGTIYQSNYTTVTATTAGHKSGMYFTVPTGLGTSYQIRTVTLVGKLAAAAGSYKLGIWSTDGTLRQTTPTIDGDHAAAVGSGISSNSIPFSDATLYDFLYGTKYYFAVEVVSGTVVLNGLVLASADDRIAFPNGMNRGLVTWNGSVWAETDTVLPLCDFGIQDVVQPSGGASGGFIISG